MKYNHEEIRKKIEDSLNQVGEYSAEQTKSIAFHMTDWLDDLSDLCEVYQDPERHQAKAVEETLMRFLLHAANHIIAASKLMTGLSVTDVFEAGALEAD
jgi:hypothetical protein